jgi:predicted molibdopterin-dependent oxidoreductase YjgC
MSDREARTVAPRKGDSFTVSIDGTEVTAYDGDSVAAVLVRAGRVSWRRTRHGDRPRGLFCGIGACQDCLVTVDGVDGVRACVAPAVVGAEIRTSEGAADA